MARQGTTTTGSTPAAGTTHHVGAPLNTSEVEHSSTRYQGGAPLSGTTAHHVGAPLSGTTEHKGAPGRRGLGQPLPEVCSILTEVTDAAASLSARF